MAEFALMGLLALGRRLPRMMEDQRAKRWAENRFERLEPKELRGSTVGIVDYGSVGREVARLCRAFGAKVLAVKRDLKILADSGYGMAGLGDPAASLPGLLKARAALARLRTSAAAGDEPLLLHKALELDDVIRACSGLWLEAVARQHTLSPGDSIQVAVTALNRSGTALRLLYFRHCVNSHRGTLRIDYSFHGTQELVTTYPGPLHFPRELA